MNPRGTAFISCVPSTTQGFFGIGKVGPTSSPVCKSSVASTTPSSSKWSPSQQRSIIMRMDRYQVRVRILPNHHTNSPPNNYIYNNNTVLYSAFSSPSSPSSSVQDLSSQLLQLLDDPSSTQRGKTAPEKLRRRVLELVADLEQAGTGFDGHYVHDDRLPGVWQLLYTTRPGTASPIQRLVVGSTGVVRNVFQVIEIIPGVYPSTVSRIKNIADFRTSPFFPGLLNVEAKVTSSSLSRLSQTFDNGYFRLKPSTRAGDRENKDDWQEEDLCTWKRFSYPVPFKLLGKKAQGWLDITYLDDHLRISRGNKGTIFVLKKSTENIT